MDHFGDSRHRHMQIERQLVHAQAERLQEIFAQKFARMDRRQELRRSAHVFLGSGYAAS